NLGCDSGCDSMAAKSTEMIDLAKFAEMKKLAEMLKKYGFINEMQRQVEVQKKVVHIDESVISETLRRATQRRYDHCAVNGTGLERGESFGLSADLDDRYVLFWIDAEFLQRKT